MALTLTPVGLNFRHAHQPNLLLAVHQCGSSRRGVLPCLGHSEARVGAIRHGPPRGRQKRSYAAGGGSYAQADRNPRPREDRRSRSPMARPWLHARKWQPRILPPWTSNSPMPAFPITKSNTRSPSSLNTPTPQGSTEEHPLCHAWSSSAPRTNTRSDDVIDFIEGRQGG